MIILVLISISAALLSRTLNVLTFYIFEKLPLLLVSSTYNYALFIIMLLLASLVIYLLIINKKLKVTAKNENLELKRSEERFKKLTNLTFEGIVIHRNGFFIDCNDSFLKIIGYEREELINTNIVEKCIHKDNIKTVVEKVKNKDIKPYEVRGKRKNQEIFPVEIESREVILDGEQVRVAAIRDLTEIKKQKEIIEREEWLLSTMMQNIPDSIYFKDLESKFIRVNRSTYSKFNVESADELIGKSDFDIFDEEHALPAYKDEQKIINTGIPIINKIEKESWKDGKIGWVSTTKLPLYDKNGKIVGTFGITRDISELKNAQENLIAEKEKFEQLLRLVPSAVFTIDTEQRVTSWNFMAEKLTGFSASEMIGKKCTDWAISPCGQACGLFNSDIPKPITDVECMLKHKSGKTITVSKNVDEIKDANGIIIGGIESFVDISERKEYETQIKKINKELAETNKSKDRFFSIIAHDLRNPFITLLGFSEMLIEDYNEFTDEEKINYLKEMEKTAKSSYQLLENLLQWSRSQTGTIKFTPQELNFVDILKENFSLLEKSAEMKNIKLESKLSTAEFIMADYDMVTTVSRNLLTNAIKFTPSGGSIIVGSTNRDGMIEFYIKDTGVGISPERVESIFRIDQTSSTVGTDGEKGSGLGLVLSNEFILKHGGEIWVESEIGKGTTFFFTLPKS
ncbi:MAG: PAS domain S-box protein [Melioribacteraceae bacterium]|nr:MAG: PAS domain S-box protein [Melioribacteraceae bacterium]